MDIYDSHKETMAEEFSHQKRTLHNDEHFEVNDYIFNLALNDLQERVISMGGRRLSEHGLPQPVTIDSDRFTSNIVGK